MGTPGAAGHRPPAAPHDLVTGGPEKADPAAVGKLAALSGVFQFPMRVKCASLAWHALRNALHGDARVATTE
jgi:nitrogen fixation NifU-like protein